jgi:hypothetical protein
MSNSSNQILRCLIVQDSILCTRYSYIIAFERARENLTKNRKSYSLVYLSSLDSRYSTSSMIKVLMNSSCCHVVSSLTGNVHAFGRFWKWMRSCKILKRVFGKVTRRLLRCTSITLLSRSRVRIGVYLRKLTGNC